MNEELRHLSSYAKKGVAAILFLFLLLGGTAAVLSVMAAGLNALSGPAVPPQITTSSGSIAQGGASYQNGASGSQAQSGWITQSGTQNSQSSNTGSPESNGSFGSTAGSSQGAAANSVGAVTQPQTSGFTNAGGWTLETPVVEALDRGGVVVGNRVQQAFGNVVAHALEVLFIQRPVANPGTGQNSTAQGTGGQSSGQSSGQGGTGNYQP